jgi:LruC domain-containing protein
MKIKLFFIGLVIILLSSCQKTILDNRQNNNYAVNSMYDLNVSDDFLWKTTKDINVIIDLPVNKQNILPVTITNNELTRVFFRGNPEDGSNRLVTKITIPSYLHELKIIFPDNSGYSPVKVDLIGDNLFFNLSHGLKGVNIPCDLNGFLTYSQGGWGAPASGNNPGTVRDNYFNIVFPSGLVVGDQSNYTMTFTSASSIENFLPGGGVSQILTQNFVDPVNANGTVGNWGAQIVAAIMNVSFDEAGYLGNGFTDLKELEYINGPFAGMTIEEFLVIANTAIGGGGLNGYNINEIGYAAEQINLAFDGYDHNFFTCHNSGGGGGGGGGSGGGGTNTQYQGTLAFEDLWPWKGDYDFNDLVITYDFNVLKNNQEEVTNIEATFTIYAIGAYFVNGFGFSLPNVPTSAITDVSGFHLKNNTIINLTSNGLEAYQPNATVIVIDDIFDVMPHPGMGIGVNTEPGSPYVTPVTIVINMTFVPGAITFNQLDIGNFNPFIFIDQNRSVEVHLPGFEPTALADASLLGTGEDAGNQGQIHLYKTSDNLPWAINIPELFNYPIEKKDITTVYNHFAEWAESDGNVFQDWYKDLQGYRNESLIYHHN